MKSFNECQGLAGGEEWRRKEVRVWVRQYWLEIQVSHTVLQERGAHGTVLSTSVDGRHLSK